MSNDALISHIDEIETYSPPMHSGTVNRRLVEAAFGAGIEVIYGILDPKDGAGHRHYHETEWQIVLMLEGEGRIELGSDPAVTVRAGSILLIPPKVPHYFEVTSETPAKLLVIYSPPLQPEGFVPA